MKSLSIRLRLTLWYLVVVGLTFIISTVGMYFGVRRAIENSLDHDLQLRITEMQQFLSRHETMSDVELPWEFRKSSGVHPGEDLYQLSNSAGGWLYQAPSMAALRVPPEVHGLESQPHFETISRRFINIRVLTAPIHVSNRGYVVQVATVVSPLYEVLAGFRFVALCTLPIVVLTAGAGGYWLSGRAMKPVRDIASAAQGISETSLSRRLVIPEVNDELRHLSETLNRMLARLDLAFTRITQFTADASHELRTPIAVIRTTSELTLERRRSVEEYEELVGRILVEAEYTSVLIENLLTLARADTGSDDLDLSLLDAREIVNEVLLVSEAPAVRKHLTLTGVLDPVPVYVLAEAQFLKRLLLILIDNALKYTPTGGSVRLSLRQSSTHAIIEVRDSGMGIPDEEMSRIFDRFYRASTARHAGIDGSGLGLAIAQWIASAHHGTIAVESVNEQGATFRLVLPLPARMHDAVL